MSYCTLFYLLLALAVFFGVYFAYNTANEDGKEFDPAEFIKILGLFLLCGIVFGVFVDVFFLATRFLLWFAVKILNFLKAEIFSRRTGSILSLLAVNAMGGYLFWEMLKEKKENKVESDWEPAASKPVKSSDEPKKKEEEEDASDESSGLSPDGRESGSEKKSASEGVESGGGAEGEENRQEKGE
ncbi:MAG: hypothetical protein HZA01_04360 [Nitrospinae bacterium]|nr:hypothetical protein [Nitrospinota bacterium]